jgi:hypothetical protein
LLALLLLPDAACLGATTDNGRPVETDVEVIRAEFGLFNRPESGKASFVATQTVPLTENQAYGWFILLKTAKPRIKWREEFTLPPFPAGSSQRQGAESTPGNGGVSVIEREVEADDGVILNVWEVSPTDPVGRYVIRVIVDNRIERVFEFNVQ